MADDTEMLVKPEKKEKPFNQESQICGVSVRGLVVLIMASTVCFYILIITVIAATGIAVTIPNIDSNLTILINTILVGYFQRHQTNAATSTTPLPTNKV